jgi:hypothetical protein
MKTYKLVWDNALGKHRWLTFQARTETEARAAFTLAQRVGVEFHGQRFALRTLDDRHLAGWKPTLTPLATPLNKTLDV